MTDNILRPSIPDLCAVAADSMATSQQAEQGIHASCGMQNVKDRDKAMMEMKRELKKLQVRAPFTGRSCRLAICHP